MKKYLSVVLAAVLLVALSVPAYAVDSPSQKEEVVYGILNTDGSVDHVYVVNRFESGTITDYGDYTEVRNLTTADPLTVNGDEITASTGADQLYYQGTLQSKNLPWNIAVTYLLDGKEVSAQNLGGKSGALQIKIAVTRNEAVDTSFYDDYALQIALSLDTGLCSNIKADGATVADAGADKQINYTVLPGSGGDFSVTADVQDFAMDAISINGIRLVLALDGGAITDQISQLTSAVRQLDNGAGSLLDGAKQLSAGMQSYLNGLKAFRDGLSQMGGLNTGAVSLRDGLAALAKQNDSLVGGALAIQQSTFDAVNAQVSSMKLCQGRLCSATLDQIGAAALYSVGPEYFAKVREEYKRRRDTVMEKLAKIPGVVCECPKGAFYIMAKLPVDNTDTFQQWLLEEFEDRGDTVMFAPGESFYGTPNTGKDEIRIAYVLKQADLERAMDLLALGIQAYNARR